MFDIEIWCDADARKRMTDTNNIPTLEDLISEYEKKQIIYLSFEKNKEGYG